MPPLSMRCPLFFREFLCLSCTWKAGGSTGVDEVRYHLKRNLLRERITTAESLRAAGSNGILYASVWRPGGSCLAAFDPNTLRGCRHDTYLGFRWDGSAVARVVEKRLLTFQSR